MKQRPRRVAFVGSSLPRKCGIATYTADLCDALEVLDRGAEFFQVAVTDAEPGYGYGPRVHFEVAQREVAAYRRAADFLNLSGVEVVNLQHEFGLFGGPAGSHVLAMVRDLRMPVVTTLHTILDNPDTAQRKVMDELASLSDRLVVMSHRGERYLREIYGVPSEKIDFIPHGIPDVPFVDPNFYKDKFEVEGKTVMLTFGLLSASKGISNVVEALPAILAKNPNVVYLVVGATHPHVLRNEGESYRLEVERLAHDRGVESSVVFHNRFVSYQELVEFLGAADVYITPYINEAQITSGTLAYAVGTGKATISTPYWYAQELLDDGCGVLVPFNDPAAIADKVLELLDDEPTRHAMRKRAYMRGRGMIWPEVAKLYARSYKQAMARHKRPSEPDGIFVTLNKRPPSARDTPPTTTLGRSSLPCSSRSSRTSSAPLQGTWLLATWPPCGTLSTPFRAASGISCPTSARGTKRSCPRTHTPEPCGRWEPCWAAPRTRVCAGRQGASSSARCAWPLMRHPPVHGPSHSWPFTSTCGDSPEIATSSWRARRSPNGCWTFTAAPVARSGPGSKISSATTTARCHTHCCSAAAG
jgi:glycosyltransferase involved in cell wall biosynthesis